MNKRYLFGFYKRAFIVFILLIPIFVVLDNLLSDSTSNFTKISIIVLVAVFVIGVVELIRYKKIKK